MLTKIKKQIKTLKEQLRKCKDFIVRLWQGKDIKGNNKVLFSVSAIFVGITVIFAFFIYFEVWRIPDANKIGNFIDTIFGVIYKYCMFAALGAAAYCAVIGLYV